MNIVRQILTLVLIVGAANAQTAAASAEHEIRQRLDDARDRYIKISETLDSYPQYEQSVLERERFAVAQEAVDPLYRLVDMLRSGQASDPEEMRAYLKPRLAEVPVVFGRAFDQAKAEIATLRATRDSAETSELPLIAMRIAQQQQQIDDLLVDMVEYVDVTGLIEMAPEGMEAKLEEVVKRRATILVGHLQAGSREKSLFDQLIAEDADNADFKARRRALEIALEADINSLDRMIDIMESMDIPLGYYRTVLVEASGNISRGFGLDVVKGLFGKWTASARLWFDEEFRGLLSKLLIFLIIVVIFYYLGKIVKAALARALERPQIRLTVLFKNTLLKFASNFVLLIGVLVALGQVGVSLGPVLAGLGVAGFIVGFALQETLANFAAGMMILVYRPFDVGDYVETTGVEGKVSHMSLVSTTVHTWDNETLIIPNNKVWGDVIRNVTHQQVRRVDLVVGVAYNSKIPEVEKVLYSILENYDKILENPKPRVVVLELGDSSVNFGFRPWVKTEDYWEAYWYLTREVKLRLDEAKITIPFPQRDVHHHYPEKDRV